MFKLFVLGLSINWDSQQGNGTAVKSEGKVSDTRSFVYGPFDDRCHKVSKTNVKCSDLPFYNKAFVC